MPNIQSAVKHVKQSAKQQAHNRAVKSEIHTVRARLYETIAGGDKTKSQETYRRYCSLVDKARKVGIIKANNADRKKARAAARLAKMA